jgi:hypothetical protein
MPLTKTPQPADSASPAAAPPPDRLNETIGVLVRREVEARLLAPLAVALSREFGAPAVMRVLREVVVEIARDQGRELVRAVGGNSLRHFRETLVDWQKGDAMEIKVLEETKTVFAFDVIRCRYAEMYRQLGIPELGPVLSCSRDYALIEGFNPRIGLKRTQTLMEGAPVCDFRYRLDA